jgi:hypothetical protein
MLRWLAVSAACRSPGWGDGNRLGSSSEVSDALVTEVNRHVVAPSSEEGFVILLHE